MGSPKSKSRSASPAGRATGSSPTSATANAKGKASPAPKGGAATGGKQKSRAASPAAGAAKTVDARKLAASKMGGNAKRLAKKDEPKLELTEEQKAAIAKDKRDKFVRDYCTRLDFQFKDGSTRTKLLEGERLETYVELQRVLARCVPRSLQIFMCLSATGTVLTAENFTEQAVYRVKEMPNAKIEATAKSKFKPQVDLRWEFYDYHGGAPEVSVTASPPSLLHAHVHLSAFCLTRSRALTSSLFSFHPSTSAHTGLGRPDRGGEAEEGEGQARRQGEGGQRRGGCKDDGAPHQGRRRERERWWIR